MLSSSKHRLSYLTTAVFILSSIPNVHQCEARKSSGVRKDEYFVPQGKSPRNQLIRICTSETTDYDMIGDIVLSVINNEFAHATSSSHIKNKRRRIFFQFKPTLTVMYFPAFWVNTFKSQAKKYYPISPCIPIFDELLKISYHKKYHRDKYA